MTDTPPKSGPSLALIIGGIGCVLVGLIAVPIIGIFAAIAIPNFIAMQHKAKRAEVPSNVDGIKTAVIAYDAAFDGYVAAAKYPASAPTEAQKDWYSAGSGGFQTIGWHPDGQVRGVYWVVVTDGGRDFEVHGICDLDGDGSVAEYVATSSTNATLVTDPNIY